MGPRIRLRVHGLSFGLGRFRSMHGEEVVGHPLKLYQFDDILARTNARGDIKMTKIGPLDVPLSAY